MRNKRRKLGVPTFESDFRKWTEHEDSLLGRYRDEEVAERTGRTFVVVRQRRLNRRLSMPRLGDHPWTTSEEKLLGKTADKELAAKLGRPKTVVAAQ